VNYPFNLDNKKKCFAIPGINHILKYIQILIIQIVVFDQTNEALVSIRYSFHKQ